MTSAQPESASFTIHGQDTLPKLFRHVVRERGDKVAMREKDLGIWRAITWREYGERAKHVGLGLVALGLQPARRRVDHRRQLSRVALHRPGHDVRGRRHQRHLHDRLAAPGRVHRQRQRHALLLRGERGAARQDPRGAGGVSAARQDHRLRHGRPARLPRRAGDVVRRAPRRWAPRTSASIPARSTGWSRSRSRTTSPSSSTPRAPRGRPRARC